MEERGQEVLLQRQNETDTPEAGLRLAESCVKKILSGQRRFLHGKEHESDASENDTDIQCPSVPVDWCSAEQKREGAGTTKQCLQRDA